MNNFSARATSLLLFFALATAAQAHGGATQKSGSLIGCHAGKADFHCHKNSRFNGKVWPNEAKALEEADAAKPNADGWTTVERPTPGKALYNRQEWDYPADDDKDCMNTRHEILA